jgi:hypothetical protein
MLHTGQKRSYKCQRDSLRMKQDLPALRGRLVRCAVGDKVYRGIADRLNPRHEDGAEARSPFIELIFGSLGSDTSNVH